MTNSRKQIRAQIALTDKTLKSQQLTVTKYKSSLRLDNSAFIALTLIAPAFIIGWDIGRKKTVSNIANHIVALGLSAVVAQLKNQLLD